MVGQTTTYYVWDNDQIIGEYAQGTNGLQTSETIYMGSTPIALIQNGSIYRIYADQIDTSRVITDASGKTVWSWESKPFGETLADADPDKDGLSLHYNQRFSGQTFDASTGLHYNFHRDYNPQIGRYMQSDPIGLDGGMNSFGYVEGNPVSALDLLGHAPTYIAGQLNRVIDVSLDAHQESEIKGAIALIKKFPKIKFTVYIYSRDKGFTSDLRSAGARAVGLHIDPVSPSAGPMTTQISDFYGNSKGLPASIHGKGGTRLPTTAMSALKVKSAPFVRAADNTGGVGGSPPVVLSFGGSATIPTIQNNRAVTHYFTHPNPESNPGTTAFTTLTYFNRYAQ